MSRNKLIGIIAACVVIIIVVVVITMPGDPPSTLEPGPEDGNGHEQPPTTTPEATEAKVAFTGVGGIHLINLDGSDERVLTEGIGPLWSPDGKKILFCNYGEGWGIINEDGTDRVIIPPPEDPEMGNWYNSYEWSPTAEEVMIAIDYRDYGGIYVADADGTDFDKILEHQYGVIVAAFSPDGNRIAYLATKGSYADDLADTCNLFLVDSDGTNNIQLVEDALLTTYVYVDAYHRPLAWSPDGKKILYGSGSHTYIVDADGTNRLQMPGSLVVPLWSPDNTHVAYTNNGLADPRTYAVKPDGTGYREIGAGWAVAWFPDSNRIVVAREDGLYAINIDGTDVTELPQEIRFGSGISFYWVQG